MIIVYYTIGKVEFGETIISFWTKPDKSDLFKEKFIETTMDRIMFRVQNKLRTNNVILEEVLKWN